MLLNIHITAEISVLTPHVLLHPPLGRVGLLVQTHHVQQVDLEHIELMLTHALLVIHIHMIVHQTLMQHLAHILQAELVFHGQGILSI